jgi:hypothetical protein
LKWYTDDMLQVLPQRLTNHMKGWHSIMGEQIMHRRASWLMPRRVFTLPTSSGTLATMLQNANDGSGLPGLSSGLVEAVTGDVCQFATLGPALGAQGRFLQHVD